MTVRSYTHDDLAACRELWVELTEWHRRIYESPGIGGADPGRAFDELLGRIGPDHLWVAELDGRVVGLTGLVRDGSEGELEPLVVAESVRGMGIGRRLADVVVAAARRAGLSLLNVRPVARNETAIRFFHESGFTNLGHVEMFMDLGDPDEAMWREGERLAGRDFRV